MYDGFVLIILLLRVERGQSRATFLTRHRRQCQETKRTNRYDKIINSVTTESAVVELQMNCGVSDEVRPGFAANDHIIW